RESSSIFLNENDFLFRCKPSDAEVTDSILEMNESHVLVSPSKKTKVIPDEMMLNIVFSGRLLSEKPTAAPMESTLRVRSKRVLFFIRLRVLSCDQPLRGNHVIYLL